MSGQPQTDQAQAKAAVQAGLDALRRGDGDGARRGFERSIALGLQPTPWFLLAQACRMTGDIAAERDSLDRLLALDPRHVGALILRGDVSVRQQDARGATAFYQQALRIAAAGIALPDSIRGELGRVQACVEAQSTDYRAHLEESLARAGFSALPPRMREAIDILTGDAEVYLQQPTSFFYPGLPHIQFYDARDFGWAAAIEDATAAICGELEAFLAARDAEAAFRPYVEAVPGRPNKPHSLLDDPKWSALYLWKDGQPTGHAAHFPAAMRALEAAPMPGIDGRSPTALFSMLRPDTHILPHNGMINTRLICHLPLIVPPGCGFRVGNQTRPWVPGSLTIFDDSIEHEAWNRGDANRIVLLFEIWRPELSREECAALTAMYNSVGLYSAE